MPGRRAGGWATKRAGVARAVYAHRVKYLLRLALVTLKARFARRRGPGDVGRIAMRVLPGDLDVLGHMNNGTYLTLQDLGRVDWMVRVGIAEAFRERGWYPVVTAQTIAYRASLHLWEPFVLETRYLGHDDFGVFLEQRFTVGGQIRSQAFVRARFLDPDGPVPVAEVLELDPSFATLPDLVPAWVREWESHTRLPSSRRDAPSEWPRAGA